MKLREGSRSRVGQFLPYFGGSEPGFGPYRALSVLFGRFWAWIWLILGHFCPISGVLGLDLAHFGPLIGILDLDLAHFEPFLPYFGGSGPGYGLFWAIFALFREVLGLLWGFWAWIWSIS